jgi:hypothetical protein
MKPAPWYERWIYRRGNEPKAMLLWLAAPILIAIFHILTLHPPTNETLWVALILILFLGVERWAFATVLKARDEEISRLKATPKAESPKQEFT